MRKIAATLIVFALTLSLGFARQHPVLPVSRFKHYVDRFNKDDNELYPGDISNQDCWNFLKTNIPLFECPDKAIEKTYYFRWWTYRKHIKKTADGYVITEFLPNVPWAGKDNAISCPAAFHFYEGRWLHNQQYLNSYADYWFHRGGSPGSYSFWPANAIYNYYLVTGKDSLMKALLPDLIKNYESWEKEKLDANGLFWQIDDRDGMEVSACGTGYRATINSYMYGECTAITSIAQVLGKQETAILFGDKANKIKQNVQEKLWDKNSDFFKMLPRGQGATLCSSRELYGYTPWYFNLPDKEYSVAWKFLMNPQYFYAPFGPTTLQRNDPGFKISYEGHECQWNGPSWPFATSLTLTALANLLDNYKQSYISKTDYYKLLKIYTNSQQRKLDNEKIVSWIDENINPFNGDWISRTRLSTWKNGSWSIEKGGAERGKDYNHSTYCDLIISGLVGIRPEAGNDFVLKPLIPKNWDYFCLDNILYKGKIITVLYDKTGTRYGRGKGIKIFINGKIAAYTKTLGNIRCTI